MFTVINQIDDMTDFALQIQESAGEFIDTIALLADNSVGFGEAVLEFAQRVVYVVKFAIVFTFLAGQALGDWCRASKIDNKIDAVLRGFVPAVREGLQQDSPAIVLSIARFAAKVAARFADGFRWMVFSDCEASIFLLPR